MAFVAVLVEAVWVAAAVAVQGRLVQMRQVQIVAVMVAMAIKQASQELLLTMQGAVVAVVSQPKLIHRAA
jgi:hypothetical protein